MKELLTLILCICVGVMQAQKIRTDKEHFTFEYNRMPNQVLPADVENYEARVVANSSQLMAAGISRPELENTYASLHGFTRVAEGGDLQVVLRFSEFEIRGHGLKDRPTSLKDKTPVYYYEYQYSFTGEMELKQGPNILFSRKLPGITDKTGFESPSFETIKKAATWKRNEEGHRIEEEIAKKVEEYGADLYNDMNRQYGYLPRKERMELKYPDPKRHPEYSDFQQQVYQLSGLLSSVRADELIPERVWDGVIPIMDSWKQVADKLNFGRKDQANLKAAYVLNLMNAHYVLDDFENARLYANMLLAGGEEKSSAKSMLKSIDNAVKEMSKLDRTSRHIEYAGRELSNELFEQQSEMIEEESRKIKMNLHDDATEHKGLIRRLNGKEVMGTFVMDLSRYRDVVFFKGTNLRLYEEDGDEIREVPFYPSRLEYFEIDSRQFVVIRPKFAVSTGGTATFTVIEKIYAGEYMTLYAIHPKEPGSQLTLTGTYMVKKVDGDFEDLSGIKYLNFKKAFAKFVSDCPDLAQEVSVGNIRNREVDLIKAIDLYDDCQK